jgi:acetyl esterase/lipase
MDQAKEAVMQAFQWLIESIPHLDQIIVGGDSAGGNLALQFLNSVKHDKIIASFLISPWLDLSLSYPSQKAMENFTHDVLTYSILSAWADATVGIEPGNQHSLAQEDVKKHPKYSPFYEQKIKVLPKPLFLYGQEEMFADSIDMYVSRLSQLQQVYVIKQSDMPHDYVLIGKSFVFGKIAEKSRQGIDLIAQHMYQASKEAHQV